MHEQNTKPRGKAQGKARGKSEVRSIILATAKADIDAGCIENAIRSLQNYQRIAPDRAIAPLHRSWSQIEFIELVEKIENFRDALAAGRFVPLSEISSAISAIYDAGRGWMDDVENLEGVRLSQLDEALHLKRDRVIPWVMKGQGV